MTNLPVDYRKVPWKAKYLTSETAVMKGWFIFGESADGEFVDISDGTDDIFIATPRAAALEIIRARDALCAVIEKHFCAESR